MPKISHDTFISTSDLNTALQSANPPTVFDVRKKPAFDESSETVPSAKWQVHDEVETWAANFSPDHTIVVYCVHGHEVSQNAARTLREMGFEAFYLEGGIDGWKKEGLPLTTGHHRG